MVSQLDSYVEKQITVITTDGQQYSGILKGFDQAINLFISNSTLTIWESVREDVYTDNIIIRGDTVVAIALTNNEPLPEEAPPIKSII